MRRRHRIASGVEGACVGAGLGLALCADLRVAAQGGPFSTSFTGIGVAADSGLSGAPAQAVGPSRAVTLMLLGDRFDAEAAERWGLVHRMVPDGAATEQGLGAARRLAAGLSAAYAEVEALLRAAAGGDLPALLEAEAVVQERLRWTEDYRAAVCAFLDGRPPSFTGNGP
ncbi:enoyl-CoA hydratase/isomerase family protein [Streptomyces yanii]|uniref:enoyl-CoA hydratase/isomerase family protein n=1 Tax=Streptomyces yanii TaxID=78510 RepID=UPI0031EBE707